MSIESSADVSPDSPRDEGDTHRENCGINKLLDRNKISRISFSVKRSYSTQLDNSKYLIFPNKVQQQKCLIDPQHCVIDHHPLCN